MSLSRTSIAALFLAFPAAADVMPGPVFPIVIDVEAFRRTLGESFPRIDPSLGRREGLEDFLRNLELYRVGVIEGLNERFFQICEELNVYELFIRERSRTLIIGPLATQSELDRIEAERRQCDYRNKETSRYFILYNDLYQLYLTANADVQADLESCRSNNSCRDGD